VYAAQFLAPCVSDVIGTEDIDFGLSAVNAYASTCVSGALQVGVPIALPTSTYIVSGTGAAASVTNFPQTFTLQAVDILGNNLTAGGDTISLSNTGPTTLTFTVVDNNDGTYTVDYTPSVGLYTISITRCCNTITISVNSIQGCGAGVTSQQNVLCNGGSSGFFNITGSGGTLPYKYSINGGAFGSSSDFTGLVAGTYSWSFKDSATCTGSGSVTITQPDALTLSLASESTVLCFGDTANFSLSASGGVTPYSYSIGSGWVSTSVFSSEPAGTYAAQVEDSNLCVTSLSVSVTQPAAAVSASASAVAASCTTNGSITISATGGTGALTYSIDGVNFQSSATFSVIAGTYTYWVVDSNSCVFTGSVVVTSPSSAILTVTSASPNCNQGNSGSVTVSSSKSGSTYSIDGVTFQSSGVFTSLIPGTYTVTAEDTTGCLSSSSITVTPPTGCPVRAALCTSHGDPHITRFDGVLWTFMAVGDFLLAAWDGNIVQTKLYACNTGIACNKAIAISVSGFASTIIIDSSNTVTVGGTPVTISTSSTVATGITIVRTASRNWVVNFPGASVVVTGFPGAPDYSLSITSGAADVTSGLCFGTGAPTSRATGLTYQVTGAADLFGSSTVPPFTPNNGPYTTNNSTLQSAATSACAPLSPSGALSLSCNSFFASGGYYDSCINDVIAVGDPTYAQSNIAIFEQLCAAAAGNNASKLVFPTSPLYSTAFGVGLNPGPYYPSVYLLPFTIQSVNALGNNVKVGGDVYTVTSTGPATLSFTIVDNLNGNYSVTYAATVPGVYTISISLQGILVASSPYTVTISTTAYFSMVLGTKAITYEGASADLQLTTQTHNNSAQQWYINGVRVVTVAASNTTMDVSADNAVENTTVIGFHFKDGATGAAVPNQNWAVYPNGTIQCFTIPNYFAKTAAVVNPPRTIIEMTLGTPTVFSIQPPI
jgi:hypothetical protein